MTSEQIASLRSDVIKCNLNNGMMATAIMNCLDEIEGLLAKIEKLEEEKIRDIHLNPSWADKDGS